VANRLPTGGRRNVICRTRKSGSLRVFESATSRATRSGVARPAIPFACRLTWPQRRCIAGNKTCWALAAERHRVLPLTHTSEEPRFVSLRPNSPDTPRGYGRAPAPVTNSRRTYRSRNGRQLRELATSSMPKAKALERKMAARSRGLAASGTEARIHSQGASSALPMRSPRDSHLGPALYPLVQRYRRRYGSPHTNLDPADGEQRRLLQRVTETYCFAVVAPGLR